MKFLFTFSLVLFTLSLSFTHSAKAQEYSDLLLYNSLERNFAASNKLTFVAGAGLSVMNSDNRVKGIVNGIDQLKGNGYGPSLNVGVLYQITPHFGLLGSAEYFHLEATQVDGKLENFVPFNSEGFSFTGSAIVSLASKTKLAETYLRSKRLIIVPYLKAGLGAMQYKVSSSPEADDNMAEEQNSSTAAIVPVGGGLRFRFSNQFSLAPEFVFNFTSADNIDNRNVAGGYTGKNDKFATASIKIMYTPVSKDERLRRRNLIIN